MQAYSNPKRANDAHALPDVEIFYVSEAEADPIEPGFYWRSCFPGCLPDGEASGPFATAAEALADAEDEDDGEDDDDEETDAIAKLKHDHTDEEDCAECRATGHVPPRDEPTSAPVVMSETQAKPGHIWVVLDPLPGWAVSDCLYQSDGPTLAIQIRGNPLAYADIRLFTTRESAVAYLVGKLRQRIADSDRLISALGERSRESKLTQIVADAVAYEAEAFENDYDISGVDLVDWFGQWRERAVAEFASSER